jgi:hypothetical protein
MSTSAHNATRSAAITTVGLNGHCLNLGRLNYLVIDPNRLARALVKHTIRAIGFAQVLEAEENLR